MASRIIPVWNNTLDHVRKHKLKTAAIAILFFVPSGYFYFTDARYVVLTRPIPFSVIPTWDFDIKANPKNPVVAGVQVEIYVENYSRIPQENVTVFILDENGDIMEYANTSSEGLMWFSYPGEPVIVYAERDGEESREILVGRIPMEWFLALSLSLPGMVFFIILAATFIKRTTELEENLSTLKRTLEEQSRRLLDSQDIQNLRNDASASLCEVIGQNLEILGDKPASDLTTNLMMFMSSIGVEEHLLFGFAVKELEMTGDKRLDRKLVLFSLVQVFEESLVHLGKVSRDHEKRQLFSEAGRLTAPYMLKHLYDVENADILLSSHTGFDRSSGPLDFDNKTAELLNLASLADNDKQTQRKLDYTIAILVRNFTAHTPGLESALFSNHERFEDVFVRVISAIATAFVDLHPSYTF